MTDRDSGDQELRRLAEAAPDIRRPTFTSAEFDRPNAFIDVVQDRRVVLGLLREKEALRTRIAALETALETAALIAHHGDCLSLWESCTTPACVSFRALLAGERRDV